MRPIIMLVDTIVELKLRYCPLDQKFQVIGRWSTKNEYILRSFVQVFFGHFEFFEWWECRTDEISLETKFQIGEYIGICIKFQ